MLTLMTDLEDRPQHLMLLLAVVGCVFGIFHLVAEFEERVFDVVEAWGWCFAIARGSYRRHGWLSSESTMVIRLWCFLLFRWQMIIFDPSIGLETPGALLLRCFNDDS